MSSFGPALTDGFARSVLELQPRQIIQVNDILQAVHREYLELEKKYTEQHTYDAGHVVTTVQPLPVDKVIDKLENDLWSQLDQVLDSKQQSIARLNIKLDPAASRVGMTVAQIVEEGFFGRGKDGARIELWKVGAWFHWKVGVRGYEDSGSSPQLPQPYRRFWKEPLGTTTAQ